MEIRDIVNYAGFVVGVLGIILSIYLFKKGLEKKDPRCYYKTLRNISKLSDDNDSKIRIFYGQDEVTRIFTTRVWIWNNGKKPINRADIPQQSRIKINLRDNEFNPKILDYEIIKTSRSEINFSVSRSGDVSLTIDFDFLDQNDGAVLEIQHTGSRETELVIEGVILGVPEGLKLIEKNKKKTIFMRAIIQTNSFLDIRRSPKKFFVFSFLMIVLFASIMGLTYHEMKTDLSVSVSASKLQEILKSEFPQVTEQNISNIMAKISKKALIAQQIFISLMVGYIILVSALWIYAVWRFRLLPYPKVLKLDDGFIKKKAG